MPEEREQLRQAVVGTKLRVSDKLGDLWWWFMIRGALALGLAVFALFWPQKTVGLLVVRRQLVRMVGAVLAVAGLILVMWPTTGVVTASRLISVVALVFGCVLVFVATRLRRLSLHMSKT